MDPEDDDFPVNERQLFAVKITAKTDVGGTWAYDWTEQSFDENTDYIDAEPARSGDADDGTLYELNNAEVDVPCFAWARFRCVQGGQNTYEFEAPATSLIV